jgi:hypothetical protein
MLSLSQLAGIGLVIMGVLSLEMARSRLYQTP